jgi:Na+/proline symporter
MEKKVVYKNSFYYLLQKVLIKEYNRKRSLYFSPFTGVIFGILGFIAARALGQTIDELINTVFSLAIIGILLPVLILIGWQNMTQTDYEEKFISKIGKEFINNNKLLKKDIELIEKRAEIGSTAVSGRTIIGVIAVSFLITLFGKGLSPTVELLFMMFILFIAFLYLLEIDRANLDVIIKQLCETYKYEKYSKRW